MKPRVTAHGLSLALRYVLLAHIIGCVLAMIYGGLILHNGPTADPFLLAAFLIGFAVGLVLFTIIVPFSVAKLMWDLFRWKPSS